MWFTDLVTPITSSDGNNRQFSKNDSTTGGSCYFLAAFNTQTNMTVAVTDSYKCLKTSTLSGTGLFLNGHDFQNLVFQSRTQEEIDDFMFFDWERKQIDLLKGLDFRVLYKTSKFSNRSPFLFSFFSSPC